MKKGKIEIPEGYRLTEVDHQTGEYVLNVLSSKEAIKDWNDILEIHGETPLGFVKKTRGWPAHLAAHEQECMIVAAYNNQIYDSEHTVEDHHPKEGYYPVFKKLPNTTKYEVEIIHTSDLYLPVSLRQVFIGNEGYLNAVDAFNKFPHIYKESRFY